MSNMNTTNEAVAKKKNPVARLVIFILEILLLAGGIVGAVLFLKKNNDPKLVAQNYFEAIKEADYASSLKYLSEDEKGHFLTPEAYAAAMEAKGVSNSDYTVEYDGEGFYSMISDNGGVLTVKVTETGKKRMLVFKEYQVELVGFTAESVTLVSALDATVKLNGEVLNESNCQVEKDASTARYTIDELYIGNYYVEVSGDMYKTNTEKITISTSDSFTSCKLADPEVNPEIYQEIADKAFNDYCTILQSAINGDDYCSVFDSVMSIDYYQYEEWMDEYDDLLGAVYMEDGFFDYFTVTNVSCESIYTSDISNGYPTIYVDLYYDTEYQYQELDYWTESYYETYYDTNYGWYDAYYSYVNGEWVLSGYSYFDPAVYVY